MTSYEVYNTGLPLPPKMEPVKKAFHFLNDLEMI